MSNTWDEMRQAKENEYFERKNKEALERLAHKKDSAPRLSPVTGKPMDQIVLHGVVIDRCPTTGGIWLDAGELDQLVEASKSAADSQSWVSSFLKSLGAK